MSCRADVVFVLCLIKARLASFPFLFVQKTTDSKYLKHSKENLLNFRFNNMI